MEKTIQKLQKKELMEVLPSVIKNAKKCRNSLNNFTELKDKYTGEKYYFITEEQLMLIVKKLKKKM